jgi:hypothetical protein
MVLFSTFAPASISNSCVLSLNGDDFNFCFPGYKLGLGLTYKQACAVGPFYTDSLFHVMDITAWMKTSDNRLSCVKYT